MNTRFDIVTVDFIFKQALYKCIIIIIWWKGCIPDDHHGPLSGINFMQLCYIMYTSAVEALFSDHHYQLIDHLTLMMYTINKTVST